MVSKMAEFTIGKPDFGLFFDFFSFKKEKNRREKLGYKKKRKGRYYVRTYVRGTWPRLIG